MLSRKLPAAAALLLLSAAILGATAPTATAAQQQRYLSQFTGGLNDTTVSFGSCISSDNTTSFTLPFDAEVTSAWVDVFDSNWSNSSNATGWLSADVGADGSVEENVTFSYYASLNLTAAGVNRYLNAINATSGDVAVPILFESCPPSGAWDLTFYNLDIRYLLNVSSNTTAPTFYGPIYDQAIRVNTSGYSNVYLPWYFYDGDGDTLNYSIAKVSPSSPGWSNVTVSISSDYLHFASTNGWTGNLTFRVNATDPANQTVSSNNITLEVFSNRAPVLSYDLEDSSLLVNTSSYLWYLPNYFYDPDDYYNGSNGTSLLYTVQKLVPSDAGWANVSLDIQGSWLTATSSNGWMGNLTFRVNATDDAGLTATSNNVTLSIRPNSAPVLQYSLSDIEMEVEGTAFVWLYGLFEEPDREYITLRAVKSAPSAAGWSYIYLDLDMNSSGYLIISHSGAWAGNVSLLLRGCDPADNCADSNEFTIFVRSSPTFDLALPSQSLLRGTRLPNAIDLTSHFSDLDADPLTYFVWPSGHPGCCPGGGPPGNNSSNITSLAYDPIFFELNGSTFDIGSNDTLWTGSNNYYIQACDPSMRCVSGNDFRVTVFAPPNHAPVFATDFPDLYIVQFTDRFSVVNIAGHFSDQDGDPLIYGIVRLNATATEWQYLSLSMNGTRLDMRSLNATWVGTLQIQFSARDPDLEQVFSNTVTIHVVAQDRPPVFSGSIPDLTMEAGTALLPAFDASSYFTDPEALPLQFDLAFALSTLESSGLTLTFNGSRLEVRSLDLDGWFGTVTLKVMATDVVGSSAGSDWFSLTVTAPPNVPPVASTPLPALTVPAGASGTVLVNLFDHFTDDRYVAYLVFGPVEGPEARWATVDLAAPGGSLTVSFTGATPPGTLTFRILVTDLRGATLDAGPFTLAVTPKPSNMAPSLSGPALVLLPAFSAQTIQLTFADGDGDALRFSVSGAIQGLDATFGVTLGMLELVHNSFDTGLTAMLTVTVDDGWGQTATISIQVAAFDPARKPQIAGGAVADKAGNVWVNGTVSAFSQPPGGGSLMLSMVVDLVATYNAPVTAGSFAFQVPSPLDVGDHTIDLTATDGFGRTATARLLITVLPLPDPLPALSAIAINGAVATEVDAGAPLSLVLSAASTFNQAVEIRWYVDGVLVGNGQGYSVTLAPGQHTIRGEASNGVDTLSIETQVTAKTAPTPNPTPSGGDAGLLVLAGAAGAGLALVGALWYFTRKR